MSRIDRSDWIFRSGALMFGLCDAAMVLGLAEKPYLKRDTLIVDRLAVLTAIALGDPQHGAMGGGALRVRESRARGLWRRLRQRKGHRASRADTKEL
jgi:hypothetical protein